MRNNASLSIGLTIAVVLATGCVAPGMGSKGNQDSGGPTEVPSQSITHIVAPGDRLSDIALKYTGQISQWEAIASYNKITDPRSLRIGDTLTIPASMIPVSRKLSEASLTKSAERKSMDSDQSGITAATTGTLALQRARESLDTSGEAGDVQIAPVNTNRTFELNPIQNSSQGASYHPDSSPPQIRVIGSYYPKGVYQQPASYSKLLMRVAPGTVFELEQEVDDWYKVVTEQGIGYIRMVDGRLISE